MLRLVCLLTNLLRKLDVCMSLKQQIDRLFDVETTLRLWLLIKYFLNRSDHLGFNDGFFALSHRAQVDVGDRHEP